MSIAGWTEADLSRWLDQRLDEFGRVKMAAVVGSIGGERIVDKSILPSKIDAAVARAPATGNVDPLTTVPQDIPGATLEAPAAGSYLVFGIFGFVISATGVGACVGSLLVDSIAVDGTAVYNDASTGSLAVPQTWLVTDVGEGDTIKLQAEKSSAGGTARTGATTSLTILQVD